MEKMTIERFKELCGKIKNLLEPLRNFYPQGCVGDFKGCPQVF